MAFSDTQQRMLAGKLSEKFIRTREERGLRLSYIEGWHAIDEANRIFGFDGWDRETVWAERVWEDGRKEPKACAYGVRVRIRVRAGDIVICRDVSGVGHGTGATLGEAHESALKEAETDATKRALTTFGNLFGLALYDKEQNGVRRSPKPNGAARPFTWVVLGPKGEHVAKYDSPETFCGGLREAMEAASTTADLQAVWARNQWAVAQLRTYCRDLKTAQTRHYADVLERLYKEQGRKIEATAGEARREGNGAPINKSELDIATPRRLRDLEHRRYVASLPCLVCGRSPSQAHHLRFAQPRSMGSKVSDEWTVPLCVIHHRALHGDGAEEIWWVEHGIDAKGEAVRLWKHSHTTGPEAPASPPAQAAVGTVGGE